MVKNVIQFAILCLLAEAATAQSVTSEPSDYPVVLTPTRLKQSLQDVPASVTILTAATLSKFGITTIPDALRLVPGMEVTQVSGNDYRIDYHGTNVLEPRRMNVLIDGVSVYEPALSRVDWANLPVVIDDIDRIEVTRGPNSASYGPNSMLSIINIITKHPSDVEHVIASYTYGSKQTSTQTIRVGSTFGDTSFRLTASKDHNDGFDFVSRIGGGHDSTDLKRLNWRSITKLSESATFDVNAGYLTGTREIPFVEQFQQSNPDGQVRDFFLSGTFVQSFSPTHQLQVQGSTYGNQVRQEWITCPPTGLLVPELFALYQSNPAYANAIVARRPFPGASAADNALAAAAAQAIARLGARAAQPTCGTINQNLRERRDQIELQDTYVVSDQLRAVSGVGVRHQFGNSDTYLAGRVGNSMWWAFSNVEYRALPWLSLNGGGYAEHDALSSRVTFSPRIAANMKASDNQSFRFVVSSGTRAPDIVEQRANWAYSANDATPSLNGGTFGRFYQSARSPGGLKSERAVSQEIGYLLNVPSIGMLFDVKIFNDRLRDLISEKLQLSSYAPTNSGSVHLLGGELQANLQVSSELTAFANYAYLDNRGASNVDETTQYSRHSGSLGASYRFGNGWAASLAYYGASGNGLGQNSYGREDVTLSKTFSTDVGTVTTSINVRRLDNRAVTQYRDVGSIVQSSYDSRLQVFGQAKISF